MRIVVWNARQALALTRKWDALARLWPDLAVIPECGNELQTPDGHFLWVGDNRTKGLGVLSFGDYRLTELDHSPGIEWAIPARVTGPYEFFLLALWTKRPYRYNLDTAIETYHRSLASEPAVIAGDFNDVPDMRRRGDAGWEYGDRTRQRDAEFFLGDLPSVSAYHKHTHEAPGAETSCTHYFRGKRENCRFHYDYCFVPEAWRLNSVSVGTFDAWVGTKLSDHVPVLVNVTPTKPSSRPDSLTKVDDRHLVGAAAS